MTEPTEPTEPSGEPTISGWRHPRAERVLLVDMMSAAMLSKLQANDHKGTWTREDTSTLFVRLLDEVSELQQALLDGSSADEILKEAADVANFAAMIADVAARRESNTDW